MFSLRRWQIWALSFAFWTAYAILDTAGSYALVKWAGEKPVVSHVVLWNFAEAYCWVLFTPFIYLISQKYSLTGAEWRKAVLIHLAASVGFVTISSFLLIQMNTAMGDAETSISLYSRMLGLALQDLPRYFVTMGITQVVLYYADLRQREGEASRLETRLAQAQLEILRGQMDPHFLFNTLNSIATLTRTDPASAENMTLQLSALLRVSLENAGTQVVPLQQELDFLANYLQIQQNRFRDRLTVRMDVDRGLLSSPVPSLILQPLVENAIRHGIAKLAAPGYVDIRVAQQDGSMKIEIADNGAGMPDGQEQGFGLRNTRARLKQLYGEGHDLQIESNPGGGCRVSLAVPLQEALRAKA